ncbi:MAG: hypothetical protein HKM22_04900 [Gammaproteobacteria bacterium]|nr:hypothetical protein [Gammaproteobacteria bacterium]
MKHFIQSVLLITGLGLTGLAQAECPIDIPAALIVECIVAEGAGGELAGAGDEFNLSEAMAVYEAEDGGIEVAATTINEK